MSDTAWQVGSALAIIGPAAGFIAGSIFANRRAFNFRELYSAERQKNWRLAARNREYAEADQKRKAAARRRDDRYRARQAEKRAARYAKTHAELAGIVAEKVA